MEHLDNKSVRYDKMDGGVIFDGRANRILISHEALEFYFERELSHEDAVFCAVDIAPLLSRVANATPAIDGKINITRGILASRDWELSKEESPNEGAYDFSEKDAIY